MLRPRGQAGRPWLGSAVDLDTLDEVARSAGLDLVRVHGAGTRMCLVRLERG